MPGGIRRKQFIINFKFSRLKIVACNLVLRSDVNVFIDQWLPSVVPCPKQQQEVVQGPPSRIDIPGGRTPSVPHGTPYPEDA
mgnify:CR=1 FL=1